MTFLTRPVRRLAWGTDWHLNFLVAEAREGFFEQLGGLDIDAFAFTGDLSDGPNLEGDLRSLASATTKPVFLVLGNHDRYHSSFAATEQTVRRVVAAHSNVLRLTGDQMVELSPSTALVGVDGWADGTAGAGMASTVALNDFKMIRDFAGLAKSECWITMREQAEEYAKALAPALNEAMARYPNVIVLTHVPPLREATWHEGKTSGAEYLPHFCNPTLGRLLREACSKSPAVKVTVLCGHTHGAGVHQEGNMSVITGGAAYYEPKIDRVIEVA